MRVNAQGHGWIGVPETGGHDMHGNPGKKQCRGVQMTQIVKTGVRQHVARTGNSCVVLVYELVHQRGYGVGVEGFSPPGSEDQIAMIAPRCLCGLLFFCLLTAVFPEHGDGVAVDADDAGPAAFGASFDTLPPDDGG